MDQLFYAGDSARDADITGETAFDAAEPQRKVRMKNAPKTGTSPVKSASVSPIVPETNGVKPTPGPLVVYCFNGTKYQSSKPTLVQCLRDISTQVEYVTAVTVPMNKADVAEFVANYPNKRFTNPTRENVVARRFSNNEFVVEWPTMSMNLQGAGNNGMHTSKGFLKSSLKTWDFVVLLGTHTAMGTLIDTGKPRSPADQGAYIDSPVYQGINTQSERQNFVAATSYLFAMAAGRSLWGIDLTESEAKTKVCQHEKGQALLLKCNPHFQFSNSVLKKANEEDSAFDVSRYQRVIGYVPALLLCLIGKQEWVEPMFTGSKRGNGELLLTASRVLEHHSPTRGEPSRREAGEIKFMIYDILNPIHAKLTGFKYKAFLKRFDTISEKGAWRTVKVDYADKDKFSTEEIRENKKRLEREARARREMSSYFLSQITL